MRKKYLSKGHGWPATWAVVVGLGVVVGCTGGGDTVISGLGNSGNYIGKAALWNLLADQFAQHPATPAVTDEEIEQIYGVIRENALEGDLNAALVLLTLAEEQREDE